MSVIPIDHHDPLAMALRYAGVGLRVVPIRPGAKVPPMGAWQDVATTDRATIESWWSGLYRGHGIGLVLGRLDDYSTVVRWIFAVDVERRRALAWSTATDTWEILSNAGTIEDRTLAAPLPLRALVEAAKADDAMAAALLAKKNPVLEQALRASQAQGVLAGKIESLLAILSARGIPVTKKAEKKIRAAADEAQIDAWLRRAVTAASADEVLRK